VTNLKRRYSIVLLLAILLLLVFASPVLAIADPDASFINAIYAYRNVNETGDMLFLVDETNYYYTLPAVDAYSAILTDFIDEDTITVIATKTIYAFHNSGYGRSVLLMYFDAANCATNTMIWLDAFVIHSYGNPAVTWDDGTAPTVTKTMGGAGTFWSTTTATVDVQTELALRIVSYAQLLDSDWGYSGTVNSLISNTTDGMKLSATGQAYFLGVLPGLNGIAPDAFSSVVVTPEVHKKTYTNAGALAAAAKLIGTPFDLTPLATSWGLTIGWLNSIVVLAIIAGLDYFLVRRMMSTKGIVLIDSFIFIGAAIIGALPLMIIIGGGAACAFFILNVFFLSKANV
jgi:hypothetical protein